MEQTIEVEDYCEQVLNVDPTGFVDIDGNIDFQAIKQAGRTIQSIDIETFNRGRGKDAVPGTKVKVKLVDKKGSADMLARIRGQYQDSLEMKNADDGASEILAERQRLGIQSKVLGSVNQLPEKHTNTLL